MKAVLLAILVFSGLNVHAQGLLTSEVEIIRGGTNLVQIVLNDGPAQKLFEELDIEPSVEVSYGVTLAKKDVGITN